MKGDPGTVELVIVRRTVVPADTFFTPGNGALRLKILGVGEQHPSATHRHKAVGTVAHVAVRQNSHQQGLVVKGQGIGRRGPVGPCARVGKMCIRDRD